MSAIMVFRNAADKGWQLSFSEMLAIDISNYNYQNGWRQMLANIFSRNDGNNKYNYDLWRAP